MSDRLQRLCDEIRDLEPADQAHVLDLLGDHGAMPEPDVERTWMAEARRRARVMTKEAADDAADASTAASRDAVNSYLKR